MSSGLMPLAVFDIARGKNACQIVRTSSPAFFYSYDCQSRRFQAETNVSSVEIAGLNIQDCLMEETP
jgi:hypothetical protein